MQVVIFHVFKKKKKKEKEKKKSKAFVNWTRGLFTTQLSLN